MKAFNQILKILFFSIFLSMSSHLLSQNNNEPVCGTETSTETLEYFNAIKPQLERFQSQFLNSKSNQNSSKSKSKNYIPIKAHVIRTTKGIGGMDEYEIKNAIASLNETFADAFMEFFLCDGINYIDNDAFYHFKSSEEKSMVEANYNVGVINIYFTDHIKNASEESICGYTYNKKDYDVIIMQNECASNNSSLAHELGHYFSLIHTHGPSNSCMTKELVNGNNCSSEGDQICDTPADPMLSTNNVNNFCRYIGTETDTNGDVFNPDTKNIMSYSMKGCRSHFTNEQLSRMYAYYMTTKTYLTCTDNSNAISKTEETKITNYKIYPNPISGDIIYIKFNNAIENPESFEISNLMGQVFMTGKLVNNQPINVGHLASGSYLMTLRSKDKKIVKRIIK